MTTISGSDRSSAPAPTHGCIRCGAPIPLADALCAACNPGGLEQPAASQAHGTVFGRLTTAAPAGGGLVLTLVVDCSR